MVVHLRQPQYRWGTALPKFACRHLHLRRFPRRSTSANLNTDRAPPSQNLLADICTCGVFPTAPPPPTSIPIGHHPPKIYLQTFAPAAFSPRFTSTNLNTDGVPPPSNLLADICTCGVSPAASPQPTSIPAGYRHPQICLQTFACGHR